MNRETFLKGVAFAGLGLSINPSPLLAGYQEVSDGKKIGIIGLDTSHGPAFAKALNAEIPDPKFRGYKVVAAYPYGSKTIASSVNRIPRFTNEVKALGVKIADSLEELIDQVDVVLLETNDGRLHLEQAIPVFKAGKRLFIDKPISASLDDTIAIFEASSQYNVPTFSSSSLRYIKGLDAIRSGDAIGPVTGVDVYSPAIIEPTHPDLMWYGIHGVEMLYAIMGEGCKEVRRVHTPDTDVVIGIWSDGRIGTFRGIRKGKNGYGGTAFGQDGQMIIGKYGGYLPLLEQIIEFFETGVSPVPATETVEMMAFMEAADESKHRGGATIRLAGLSAALMHE